MSNSESPVKQYQTSATGDLLYECVLCGGVASAADSYIVCPECGGKLERIKLVDPRYVYDDDEPECEQCGGYLAKIIESIRTGQVTSDSS